MSSSRLSLADLCQSTPPSTPSSPRPAMSVASSCPVHAGTKRRLTIDDQDEDVRIAIRALGDMKSRNVAQAHAPSAEAFAQISIARSRASSISQSTPFLTPSSTSASTSSSSPLLSRGNLDTTTLVVDHSEDNIDPSLRNTVDPSSEDFVSRVSHLPIVNSALKAYEHSKECSKVVKYGATLVESSVKTISRPVINRLPVDQIDEFACRQLDRFGYPKRNPTPSTSDPMQFDKPSSPFQAYRQCKSVDSVASSRCQSVAPSSTGDFSLFPSPQVDSREVPEASGENSVEKQTTSRSKWQTVLSEAGGISAAVSEESMKRLQYCLHWLQFATERIDTQMAVLRSFIDSFAPQSPHQNDPHALVPLQTMRTLGDVRRDVVNTIRTVVDIISKYAGGALPEPARLTVRSVILRLPARWANANGDSASNKSTPIPSPNISPKSTSEATSPDTPASSLSLASHIHPKVRPTAGRATHPTAIAATQTAQRILALATESLDMMRSVTNVFKESLERAEAWVERLRVVGIQRHSSPSPLSSSGLGLNSTSKDAEPHPEDSNELKPSDLSTSTSTVSSMQSLTSLSIVAQSSPPTSVADNLHKHEPANSKSEEGETEAATEDKGQDQRVIRSSILDESAESVTDEAKTAEIIGASKKMDMDA